MRRPPCDYRFTVLLAIAVLLTPAEPASAADAPDQPWIDLSENAAFTPWQADHSGWTEVGHAELDPEDKERLTLTPGRGVLVSTGDGADLLTADSYRDVDFKCEFLVPQQSNSGVKLNALYEIQIRDTFGQEIPNGDCCGGIYPRAELEPRYRLLDKGLPPRVNAARPAGEWQSLELRFYSPRFDAAGNKVANARFENVVLNGELIHQRAELQHPTGHAWNTKPEVAEGPLLLQGDHGAVAFRKVHIRRLASPAKP